MSSLPAKTSTGFVILPSHYRARLDVKGGVVDGRQRVLCGALGEDGRPTCGNELGYVAVRGPFRELVGHPGWVFDPDSGVWRATSNQTWREAHGLRPAYRRKKVTRSEGEHKGLRFHPGTILTRFLPLAAVCYSGHINICEADWLDVMTEEDYARSLGLAG